MDYSRCLPLARTLVWVCAIACAMSSRAALGLIGGTEPACSDSRYDAVGLILTSYNSSQECGHNISGNCVLIDRQTILVARHSVLNSPSDPLPAAGARKYKVRFRRAPDGRAANAYAFPWPNTCHGVYTQVWVHEFKKPGFSGVDILVGTLETPIDHIQPIPVETLASRLPGTNAQVLVAGWGYQGPCFREGISGTLLVKRGPLPLQSSGSCCITINPCSSPSSVGACYSCPTAPAGQSWILPNYLDSGAPVLVETSCRDPVSGLAQLRVVGIVSTTLTAWTTVSWNQYTPALQLPPAPTACDLCVADFDGDGVVEVTDLFGFLNAWFEVQCLADLDKQNAVNLDDLMIYLSWFFAGCP